MVFEAGSFFWYCRPESESQMTTLIARAIVHDDDSIFPLWDFSWFAFLLTFLLLGGTSGRCLLPIKITTGTSLFTIPLFILFLFPFSIHLNILSECRKPLAYF